MKVFLDIGAHTGETLRVVRSPEWGFQRIVCFEPAPACWPSLEALADARTEIRRFGLWKGDERLPLHNAGAIGASMSPDKDDVTTAVTCEFRDVAAWFSANLAEDDVVYAKINAEGAEADIIERLSETGLLGLIDHLLIHFDVRKIPNLRHREGHTRRLLDEAGVDYQSAEDIQFGGVYRGTRNWLRWCHNTSRVRDLRFKTMSRIGHRVRVRLYPLKQAAQLVRQRLPSAGTGHPSPS